MNRKMRRAAQARQAKNLWSINAAQGIPFFERDVHLVDSDVHATQLAAKYEVDIQHRSAPFAAPLEKMREVWACGSLLLQGVLNSANLEECSDNHALPFECLANWTYDWIGQFYPMLHPIFMFSSMPKATDNEGESSVYALTRIPPHLGQHLRLLAKRAPGHGFETIRMRCGLYRTAEDDARLLYSRAYWRAADADVLSLHAHVGL